MDAPGRAGRIKAEINVTPLVDIVLVLLIIFIVITPAVNSAVKLPLARHSVRPGAPGRTLSLLDSAARDPLTGKVTGPARVLVDAGAAGRGEPLGFRLADPAGRRALQALIAGRVRSLDDPRVFVKADADLPYRYVDELFQVCREAGASEAAIVTGEDRRPEGGP